MASPAAAKERFRPIRQLGAGGMGVVLEAFDVEHNMRVALKTVRSMSPEALALFKREFRAVQDVNHPNLVTLHELLNDGDEWMFSMELVEGIELLPWMRDVRLADDDSPPSTERAIRCDYGKLRSALAQLTSGLAALHAAGLVHRDVKPDNVIVAEGGRAVLFDFGLVAEVALDTGAADAPIVGTPSYMAPEQAAGGAIGPAADFYALGVIAYEALTGRLPFDGAPLEVMLRKQREAPKPPGAVAAGVPEDLDRLCVALLAFDPGARPDAHAILRALGVAGTSIAPSHSGAQATPFVGRADELDALAIAFARRSEGQVVVLAGESGIGKSCLVRRFLDATAASERELVVLPGRCYEREALPYKGLDGVVDALARFLKSAPRLEQAQYVPTRPGPLALMFPVLRRVEAIAAAASKFEPRERDPIELRARAFGALRDLLVRVAERKPTVIAIDDLQWADAESLALLRELLRPPDPPPLLLIATVRSGEAEPGSVEARVRQAIAALPSPHVIELGPLSATHARELASRLLKRASLDQRADADAIAREAEGHPLYIDALVRHSAITSHAPPAPPRLEDAIGEQVRRLDVAARRVIELVAVAGAPLAQAALEGAAEVDPQEFARIVSFLRVAHLASISGARGSDTIDAYHDKVRTAVLAGVDDVSRRAHHLRLAIALEAAETATAEALATHWFGAGDAERGAAHAERAGDDAASALAFEHAAALYERALAAAGADLARRVQLGEKIGLALADAGHSVPSARAFQEAARDASPAHAIDLRRRAAEQLLRGGRFDAGLDAVGEVLTSIGLRLPRSPFAAVVAILFWRAYLAVRGLDFRARDAREITQTELTKLDVCWSIAMTLSFTDNVRGAAFSGRNVVLALRCGDPYRVARALALHVGYVASQGDRGWTRAEAILARAKALAEQSGNPYALGWIHASTGLAHWLRGEYAPVYEHMTRARAIFAERCTGAAWEIATVRSFEMNVLAYRGDLLRLAAEHPACLRDALERGDLYSANSLRTALPGLVWLVHDRADEARGQVVEAEGALSSRGFHVMHSRALNMHVFIDLYEGRPADAVARTDAAWPAARRSLILRISYVRTTMLYLRTCARIALAARGGPGARALLDAAERDARVVESPRVGRALGRVLRAGIASARGAYAEADPLWAEAIEALDASAMELIATAARRARGLALGGEAGAQLVREAEAWLRDRGALRPDHFARALVPQVAPSTD